MRSVVNYSCRKFDNNIKYITGRRLKCSFCGNLCQDVDQWCKLAFSDEPYVGMA